MSGKTTAAIIVASIVLSAPAAFFSSSEKNGETVPDIPSQLEETSLAPENAPPSSFFEVKLQDDHIYLSELDGTGKLISKKTIDYIDIYSLYSSQLDLLRLGAKFDTREAAAEFIQDLGS